jgi:hypothetical protein
LVASILPGVAHSVASILPGVAPSVTSILPGVAHSMTSLTRQSEGVSCDLWAVARENLAHAAKTLIHRADVLEENNL